MNESEMITWLEQLLSSLEPMDSKDIETEFYWNQVVPLKKEIQQKIKFLKTLLA